MVTVKSIRLNGIDCIPVDVECQISEGVGIHLVGLSDTSVKESLLRMATALQAKGYQLIGKKLILNIAPADLHKSGAGFDLPMAIAFIAESGQERLNDLDQWIVIGELGLDGSVRGVRGCVQAVQVGIDKVEVKGIIIPADNGMEVADVFANQVPVYGVRSLGDAVDIIKGVPAKTVWEEFLENKEHPETPDFSLSWTCLSPSIRRAAEIAAAGGHNILFVGPPGSGKASAAKAIHALLPRMSFDEIETTAAVYSAADKGSSRLGRACQQRPFRAPHISSSLTALLGGGPGDDIHPGEVSLAHNGVLFVDELVEAPKVLQEALRVPLEDHKITISRLRSKVEMPANFLFVGACNPCPCGYYGEGERCTCTPRQRALYIEHLNPGVMEHISMQVWCHPAGFSEGESLEDVRARVEHARFIQRQRYVGLPYGLNDRVPSSDIQQFVGLGEEEKTLLDNLVERLGLSARSYSTILRLARTIADLEHSEEILGKHIAEASCYRFLDRMQY